MRSARLCIAALFATLSLASSDALAASDDVGDSGGDVGGDPSTAWFVSPLPNTVYEGAPVSLGVEIDVYQGTETSISDVEVFLDGVSLGAQPCATGCVFEDVELKQGIYELSLVAAPSEYSTSVTVYVDTPIPSDEDEGVGCNAQGSDAAPWMLALPILVLAAGLRRRKS